jgi:hypothetical protein
VIGLGLLAKSSRDRLVSTLEVERGGKRVSEGDPENWAAVARAISDRIRELGWRQRELAARSHAPVTIAGTAFLSRFIGRRACR